MYSGEYLQKKLDGLLVRQFINYFRGCGKTTSIVELAKQRANEGKKVCIVTPHTWILEYELLGKESNISVKHLDKVLKYLYKTRDKFENIDELVELNARQDEEFDYVFIDPDCHEQIILELVNKLDEVRKVVNKW